MDIPTVVRNEARHVGADDWLRDLPDLVAELCQRWEVTRGRTYPDATEAYVAEATRADGTPAVLKVFLPREGIELSREIVVLRLADGDGCVRLYETDEACGAILLERLGPSLRDLRVPIGRRHEILCDVAQRLWRPAADAGLPTGAEKARWLIERIVALWQQLDRPCSEHAVDHAIVCAEKRAAAHDDERACLVHGDVHQWNTLQAGAGWKLVDPDGLLADPEYDLGVIMREDPEELLRDGEPARVAWLARRTGCDPVAIHEWGVVERVSTGLLGTAVGLQPIAGQLLAAAERVAADHEG